jgi:hypothetical protein
VFSSAAPISLTLPADEAFLQQYGGRLPFSRRPLHMHPQWYGTK